MSYKSWDYPTYSGRSGGTVPAYPAYEIPRASRMRDFSPPPTSKVVLSRSSSFPVWAIILIILAIIALPLILYQMHYYHTHRATTVDDQTTQPGFLDWLFRSSNMNSPNYNTQV